MLEVLDSILGILKLLMIPSFIVGGIGVFFGIYARSETNKTKRKPWKIAKILIGQLAVVFILSYGILWIINIESRNELKSLLNEKNIKITVNGENINTEYSLQIIAELNKIKSYSGHHSHPEKEFEIGILSGNTKMDLTIKKDSDIKNEYWVYWNKYSSTNLNEIGRVTTNIFEK